jgi:hypothetical protein
MMVLAQINTELIDVTVGGLLRAVSHTSVVWHERICCEGN